MGLNVFYGFIVDYSFVGVKGFYLVSFLIYLIDYDAKIKALGGGANITTLHAHGQLHFPKASMVCPPSLPLGLKKLHCFFCFF